MSARRRVLGVARSLCLIGTWLVAGASLASAQSIEVNRFRPAPTYADGFAVSSASVPGHLQWDLALHLDYARDPLIVTLATGREYAVISDQLSTNLAFALGLGDRSLVFAGVPLNLIMTGDDPPRGIVTRLPRPDGFGFGDAYLGGRVRVLGDEERVALAVQGMLSLPLASVDPHQLYSGDDAIGGQMRAILDLHIAAVAVRANAGVRFRQDERLHSSIIGDEFSYGLGLQYKLVGGKLRLLADLFGGIGFRNPGTGLESPFEASFGARYVANSGVYAGLGIGPGLVHGVGAPDWRVVLSVGFATNARPRPARPAPVAAPPTAAANELMDDDLDGVVNAVDACATQAEDRDGYEDFDGCPDLDNDADTILDEVDGCPTQAEDRDNYEDLDGCPDPDNDADGVLDVADKCPLESGDPNADGCVSAPAPAAPAPPPIAAPPAAHIRFAPGKDRLPVGAIAQLREFKRTLEADPDQPVRIEGYADPGGQAASSLRLSTRRARAIGRWLISQGIAPERVQLVACGAAEDSGSQVAQDNYAAQAETTPGCVPVPLK